MARQRLLALFLLGLVIAGGWFAYAPALSGAFLLDDLSNLGGLSTVEDRLSALIFIFSGEAGPAGRPLALATFVPQAEAWGQSAEPFLRVNILIHLMNACLLAWVLYRLSLATGLRRGQVLFASVAAAAVWLFMPLLASSSLMVIQRMTTLCASFMFLAIAGYLHARQGIDTRPTRSLIGMSSSLVVGTALATLAKESGALLPVYVLVLEATVLGRPGNLTNSRWQIWKSLFLLLPTAALVGYLGFRVPYPDQLVLNRGFTGWERMLTEARILWEYLFNALLPQPGNFGPFRDGYPVARTILSPVTFLAAASWVALFICAVSWRRRHPLFGMAVLWFLGGHLLESTVLPLELYFEHRNYVPIVGPVFALCAALAKVRPPRQRLVYAGISSYVLINALVLFSHTQLWGNPSAAARHWQEHFPGSVRAATTAATYRLAEEGPRSALVALRRLVDEKPEAGYVGIPALNLACIIAPQADLRTAVADLHDLLSRADFSYTAGTMLSQLLTTVNRIDCNGVDRDTVHALANTLLANRRYKHDAGYNQLHHQLIARIMRKEGRFEQVIHHLEKAISHRPSADLNMMMITTYADAGELDEARDYIEQARVHAPGHPLKRFVWLRRLDNLGLYIDRLDPASTLGDAT